MLKTLKRQPSQFVTGQQVPMTPTNDSPPKKSIGTKIKENKKLVFGAVVAVIVLVVAISAWKLFGGKSSAEPEKTKDKQRVKIVTPEDAMVELKATELEDQRTVMQKEYDALMQQRQQLLKQLQMNQAEAERNSHKFRNIFTPQKASHDDNMNSYEEESSLETAFMLKGDMDGMKNSMVKLGEELKQQAAYLSNDLKNIEERLYQIQQSFQQNYENAKIE